MPFTLSNAAAALPLRRLMRGAAVFPALVVGCFVPDVPYFLPDPLERINAHQLPGFVLFGVPCGWALLLLWRFALARPCGALLPRRWGSLVVASDAGARTAAWAVTLSLVAGAASHVAWDAFTHRRGAVVQAFPALAQPLLAIGGRAIPTYVALQHASTVLGLVALALHARRRMREHAADDRVSDAHALSTGARIGIVALLAMVAAAGVWMAFSPANPAALRFTAYNLVCRSVSCAAAVLAAWALAWHARERLRRYTAPARASRSARAGSKRN